MCVSYDAPSSLPLALLKSPAWSTAYMGTAPPEVKTEAQGDSMESSDCSNTQNQVVSNGTAVSTDGHAIMPPDQARAFVFPQPTGVPLSPGLLSAGIFNQNNNVPITPTLLTPVTSFSDTLFKGSSLYSPLTLAPPSSIAQCLPKTPTLPPPSPHATAFPIMGPNYFTGIFNPAYKGFDDLSKLGGLSPLLMSPAAAFPSSHVTQFFPSNIPTAESVASDGTALMNKSKLMSPPTQSGSQHSNPSGPPSIASSMHEEEERKEVRVHLQHLGRVSCSVFCSFLLEFVQRF